ncbi:MAG: YHS domain-containing (seleno)protein [Granulosicoccus sp.]
MHLANESSRDHPDFKRRNFLLSSAGLSVVAISLIPATKLYAASSIYTNFLSDKAVGGYDPVAYFTENKPVKGDTDFSTEYMGALWLFSSQNNLEAFKADPHKYAPQYGGYCAYAIATGTTAKGDPKQWEIVDDKLYLNINSSIRKRWSDNKEKYIPDADTNWPGILK